MSTNVKPGTVSVQSLYQLLARTRLLTPDAILALAQRWRAEAGGAGDDVIRFGQWLVAREYVTAFQADRLLRGHTDHYFLNQYKVLERIGLGRMAGVFKAQHQFGQIVAVKVLPPSKAHDPQVLARFHREADLALRLKHPNVVRTFQTGVTDGLYYLVMEYLEGETLKDVLQRRGKLPPVEAVRLFHQALTGLQHLHDQGMIHRDLNPSNLMLVSAPGQPDNTLHATVKILDIGLGREVFDDEDSPVAANNLTTEGALLGNPEYTAPEQTRDARAADIRSDIYSLGCTLYHTLAGQLPFPEKQLVRLMICHATEQAPPLKQFNASISDGLQKIVDGMMAKDPAQRFQTPDRAAQALQAFLSGGSTGLVSPDTDPRMQSYLQWLATQGSGASRNASGFPASGTVPERVTGGPAASGTPPPAPVPTGQVNAIEAEPEATESGLGLSQREIICVGVGAGGMLVVLLLGWFLIRMLFR